jgi:glyoxylase-like metal-dependent hydrolase (beta-lactamase superfamily II)
MEQVAPHLWHWTAPHPDWKPSNRGKDGQGWEETVSSYGLIADGELVLVDPLVPSDDVWEALDRDVEGHGPPAIVITVHWHARSAEDIAKRYDGTSIWAPSDGQQREADPTHTYGSGDQIPGGIRAFASGMPGERALYVPSHRAVVFGDAVLDGVRVLPESWLDKGTTMKDVLDALRPLLNEEIDLVLLTHGGPVADGAREKLENALEV